MARRWGVGLIVLMVATAVWTSGVLAQGGMGYGRMGRGPGQGGGAGTWIVPGLPESSLTGDQRQKIATIRQQTQAQVQSVRGNAALSSTEKAQKIAQARKAGHDKVMAVLTPEQRKQVQDWIKSRPSGAGMGPGMGMGKGRGMGMRRGMGPGNMGMNNDPGSMRGMQMWSVPGLADSSLTAQQKQKISAIRMQTQAKVQAIRRNSKLTEQEKTTQIESARKSGHAKVMDVLTSEQKSKLQSK